MNRNNTGVIFFDSKGTIFFQFYEAKYETFTPIDEIPQQVKQAVIVAEDKEFYRHPGFSIKGIIGALIANFKRKELDYGGSTITQQLVKINLLNSQKNFLRKYQELVLAQELERRYTKDEILEMYLNTAYFGEGATGVEEASKTYFGKPTKDLQLTQAAFLAGLLTAPSKLSPISGNQQKSIQRRNFILQEMLDEQYISPEQEKNAIKADLGFNFEHKNIRYKAPHFALMVKDYLIHKYGEEQLARSGFKIYTTIDLDWQAYAEQVVKDQVEKLKPNNVSNGAAVVMDPKTGEVKALVGSKNWNDEKFGKVNMANTPRQPGSSFKPIVYIAALERHLITNATVLHDQPITYKTEVGPYSPKDYDGRYRGLVLTRRALANSLNIPSVEIMSKLGVPQALEMARRLGISTLGDVSEYGLSLVLGSGEVTLIELTNAYATFANEGKKNDITLITKIEDKTGKIVYDYKAKDEPILDPQYPFLISSILSDTNARREMFGDALDISRIAAVKTGTTNDYRDSLTLGYTPSLAIGVWVGNNDNKPMDNIAGSLGAAPIWKALMQRFLDQTPSEPFNLPDNIVKVTVCRESGLLLSGNASTSSGNTEYFMKGTEPTKPCVIPRPTSPVIQVTPFQLLPTIIDKQIKEHTQNKDKLVI